MLLLSSGTSFPSLFFPGLTVGIVLLIVFFRFLIETLEQYRRKYAYEESDDCREDKRAYFVGNDKRTVISRSVFYACVAEITYCGYESNGKKEHADAESTCFSALLLNTDPFTASQYFFNCRVSRVFQFEPLHRRFPLFHCMEILFYSPFFIIFEHSRK